MNEKKLHDFFMRLLSDEAPRIAHLLLTNLSEAQKTVINNCLEEGIDIPVSTDEGGGYHRFIIYASIDENPATYKPTIEQTKILIVTKESKKNDYNE